MKIKKKILFLTIILFASSSFSKGTAGEKKELLKEKSKENSEKTKKNTLGFTKRTKAYITGTGILRPFHLFRHKDHSPSRNVFAIGILGEFSMKHYPNHGVFFDYYHFSHSRSFHEWILIGYSYYLPRGFYAGFGASIHTRGSEKNKNIEGKTVTEIPKFKNPIPTFRIGYTYQIGSLLLGAHSIFSAGSHSSDATVYIRDEGIIEKKYNKIYYISAGATLGFIF